MEGEYSADPSENCTLDGENEDPSVEASIPPSTDLRLPAFFSKRDIRVYDPLKSFSRLEHDEPAPEHPSAELNALQLAENWIAGSSSEHDEPAPEHPSAELNALPSAELNALQLAENWIAGSDDEATPAPEHSIAELNALAETWIAGSDDEAPPAPAQMVVDLAGEPEPANQPAHGLNALAETWIAGSVDEPAHVLDLAVIAGEHESEPALADTKLADQPAPAIWSNPLQLAESWIEEDNESTVPGPLDTESSALNLAEIWFSGSDSAHNEPDEAPGPDVTLLNLYDAWKAGEMSGDDTHSDGDPIQRQGEWKYGPQHFSDLEEHMFEIDED
jgi:hypothetical protein